MCMTTIAYIMWMIPFLGSGFTHQVNVKIPDGKGGTAVYKMLHEDDMDKCVPNHIHVPGEYVFCEVWE